MTTTAPASTAPPPPAHRANERTLTLGPLATAPRCARATTREALQAWHLAHLTDPAETITSELVTNAITASTAKAPPGTQPRHVTLRLTINPARAELLIAVWDPDPTPPAPASPTPYDETGRGLLIVTAFSARWGSHPAPTGGKWTWATLPIHPGHTP